MDIPKVIIASCSNLLPQTVLSSIFGDLGEGEQLEDTITSYPWHVDTKYYTADISICTTLQKTIGTKSFADSVYGFVLHFDPNSTESFQKVKSWLPYLKELSPAVQILLCVRSQESDVHSRHEVITWCLDNSFELVETDSEEANNDEEDEFQETVGVQRVIQAIQAHSWPNLTLKDEPVLGSEYYRKILSEEKSERNKPTLIKDLSSSSQLKTNSFHEEITDHKLLSSLNTDQSTSTSPVNKSESRPTVIPTEDQATTHEVQSSKVGNDADPCFEDDFEKLLQNFHLIKEKAQSLPFDERKKYAEEVATNFWKSIGGDESEIDCLSDSD